MKSRFILTLTILITVFELAAQKQYNKWYTSSVTAIGVDFNTNPPSYLSNSSITSSGEGSTGICDSGGEVIFYTEGVNVYNRNNVIAQNGILLPAAGVNIETTTQNAIIIPFADTNYYGLIINDGESSGTGTGLYYSIFDRTLDGGLGGINNVKNIHFFSGTNVSDTIDEKLVAIRHANGCDFWIVTVRNDDYYAFRFTSPSDYTSTDLACTIIDTVITPNATFNDPELNDPSGMWNPIKVSPKNNKIALLSIKYLDPTPGFLFTLDFDNATGLFNNPFRISDSAGIAFTPASLGLPSNRVSAVCFSPNGDYLYYTADSISDGSILTASDNNVYRFNMTLPQNQQAASYEFVGRVVDSLIPATPFPVNSISDMQIGPDGKIYISALSVGSGLNATFLSAIDNPDGVLPSIIDVAVDLNGVASGMFLPSLITDYLINVPSPCSFPLTAGYLSSTGCFSTPISFTDTSLGDPTDWSWNFDDLVSGVSNTSILQNPTHAFSAVGAYNVELIVTRGCRSDTIVSSISVTGGTAPTISADVDICEAESTTLSVAGGADFVWSTSSSLSDSTIASPVATPLLSTTYYVTTTASGCDYVDSVLVSVNLNQLINTSQGGSICQGDSLLVFGSYQNVTGTYFDSLQTSLGCDSVLIASLVVYQISYTSTGVSICMGDSVLLAGAYQLASGTFLDSLQTVSGCDSIVSTGLVVNGSYEANYSQSICLGDSALILGSYESESGNYLGNFQTMNGCDSNLVYTLAVDSSPIAGFSLSADNGLMPLLIDFSNTSVNADSYDWIFGDGGTSQENSPSYLYEEEGEYTVMMIAGNNAGCIDTLLYSYINVSYEVQLFIPQVFTPNGDGYNDVFTIIGAGYEKMDIEVYNRWGVLLMQWDVQNSAWDGNTFAGQEAPTGTYYYIVTGTTLSGDNTNVSGVVTLLR